jgi:hypothetical protein
MKIFITQDGLLYAYVVRITMANKMRFFNGLLLFSMRIDWVEVDALAVNSPNREPDLVMNRLNLFIAIMHEA